MIKPIKAWAVVKNGKLLSGDDIFAKEEFAISFIPKSLISRYRVIAVTITADAPPGDANA